MKTTEITIRDPFILNDNGTFYLYGTRSETAWAHGSGFDVYESFDLENWVGPKEIFKKPEGFWADKEYWAPECIKANGQYYLVATFGTENRPKGIHILVADNPTGPFELLTDKPVTPEDWNCIDGSVFIDKNNVSWLIFSHGFPQEPKGAIVASKISKDMSKLSGKLSELFLVSQVNWTVPIPFSKEEFGLDGDNYFSDGPYLFYGDDHDLYMLWSSWSEQGYAMAISKSMTGEVEGPWIHANSPIYYGGGHGMVFADNSGRKLVVWHSPNEFMKEHPVFKDLKELQNIIL